MKNKFISLLGLAVVLVVFSGCEPLDQGPNQVREPAVAMSRVTGYYVHVGVDGYRNRDERAILINEVFAEDGWNGRISFSPPIGPGEPIRCRISGTDLVVELPAKQRALAKMFSLYDSKTITGYVAPWDGTYRRGVPK